jgi:metal-responsive CopG/Arc/MetJ family transcriptional regulator
MVDMNPKKPKSRKSRSAGISLEPELKRQAKELAETRGFNSLSALVRSMLMSAINAAENAAEKLDKKGDQLQKRASKKQRG